MKCCNTEVVFDRMVDAFRCESCGKVFLSAVKKDNYLTNERFLDVLKRYRANRNDKKASDEISKIYLQLSRRFASKRNFTSDKHLTGENLEDMIMVGVLACVKATDKFDADR